MNPTITAFGWNVTFHLWTCMFWLVMALLVAIVSAEIFKEIKWKKKRKDWDKAFWDEVMEEDEAHRD